MTTKKIPETMRIDWAPLMPGIIGMTQQGYNQVQIAKACGVTRSALNSMMARKGHTNARIKHDFNKEQALQARLKEVDDILETVGNEYGGKEHALSPECIPASSICSIIPATTTSCPSDIASTSTSVASGKNLSISIGCSGDALTAFVR